MYGPTLMKCALLMSELVLSEIASCRVVCVKCQKIKSAKAENVMIYRFYSHLLNDSSDLSDSKSIKNDCSGVFKSWAMFPIIATIC